MLHVAIHVKSSRNIQSNFTIPGLGDKIHTVTCAWVLTNRFDEPIMIHLSKEKFSELKRSSLEEIIDLFPANKIFYRFHDYLPLSNSDWILYLRNLNIDAKLLFYRDHPGSYEHFMGIDISQYLIDIPILELKYVSSISLPTKFIVCQWDSTAQSRSIPENIIFDILNRYRDEGFSIITVGGESSVPELRYSLKDISYFISRASFFVGVDSGFSHLAYLLLPIDKIHLYNLPKNYWSHHLLRFIDKGGKINLYYKKLNLIRRIIIILRYDSPRLLKVYHSLRNFALRLT
jgi:hypothetical protein